MKKVVLVCFGKLKFPGYLQSCSEYEKRLGRYTQFKTVELKPLQDPIKEEATLLEFLESSGFKKLVQNPVIWALDETGTAMKTSEWVNSFDKILSNHNGELVLLIGGSMGFGDTALKRANKKISLGPQTLSHELARVVLLEQVYRALSVQAGHPYHNEG